MTKEGPLSGGFKVHKRLNRGCIQLSLYWVSEAV